MIELCKQGDDPGCEVVMQMNVTVMRAFHEHCKNPVVPRTSHSQFPQPPHEFHAHNDKNSDEKVDDCAVRREVPQSVVQMPRNDDSTDDSSYNLVSAVMLLNCVTEYHGRAHECSPLSDIFKAMLQRLEISDP